MTRLEGENASASGNLQALEVANEIALFNGQKEIKSRNAINGQLNALLVAESNRQNQEAQDQLESLAVGSSSQYEWDLSDQSSEPIMPGALTE